MGNRDNGGKEANVVFDRGTFEDDDYIYPQGIDNIKLLMTPGDDDPSNLYMRAAIPTTAMALAFVIRKKRCKEHYDIEGVINVKEMVAALVGVAGRRAELVSETLIGEKRNNARHRTLSERIRDMAGVDKEE